ncbi:MAG: hypothetical protein KGL53_06695, partial [Elusimicrobia bacterium]|nr:hypothetical protein [Elusimicrobiota bacterium]
MTSLDRLRICGWLALLPTAPIAARLGWLQCVRHTAYEARVDRSVDREDLEIIPRGRILDRNGLPLAQSVPAWSAFLDLKVWRAMPDRSRALKRLGKVLSLRPAELSELTAQTRRTVWLKRKMTLGETRRVRELSLPCVGLQADELRTYPNGDLARPLLGGVNTDG